MPQNIGGTASTPVPGQQPSDPMAQPSGNPANAMSAFVNFVKQRMGAAPAGGQVGGGSLPLATQGSPGQIGQMPPNMTGGAPAPAGRAVAPMSIPPPPVQNYEQYEATKSQIGRPGSLVNSVAKTINSFKKNKEQTEFAKAQNSLMMFQNAIAQGDMQVADLLAKDPKIIKSWEKYLKMEFPRKEGEPEMEVSGQKVPTTVPAPPGQLGGVNQPGGIAVPQDMTPEGQLHRMQMEAALKVAGQQSPEQLAAPILGENVALSGKEFKQAMRFKYGFEMTPVQERELDATTKSQLVTMQYDILKFAAGQEAMTERAMLTAKGAIDAAKIASSSRLGVAKMHMQQMEKMSKAKGETLNTQMYTSMETTYRQMASNAQRMLASKEVVDNEGLTNMYKQQFDTYTKKAESVKDDYEGYKLAQQLLFGDNNDAGDTINITPPSE